MANSSFALTEAGKEALKKLTAAMRAEAKEVKQGEKNGKPGRHPDSTAMQSAIFQVEGAEYSSDRSSGDSNLSSYLNYFSSAEVRAAGAAFKAALAAERDEKTAAEVTKLEAILSRCKEAVKTAKEPAELDEIMSELETYRRASYDPSPQVQDLAGRIESAKSYLAYWQEYLAAAKAGNGKAARQALSNLRNNTRVSDFGSRSELLAMEAKWAQSAGNPNEIVLGIKSLDEIQAAVVELQKLRADSDQSNNNVYNVIGVLSSIDRAYREYLGGLPISLELGSQNSDYQVEQIGTKIIDLRSELLKLVLPRYVNAPKGTEVKPGESVNDFLDRLTEEALQRQDASAAYRAREAKRILARGNSYSSQDSTALNAYVSGQNQEAAGQFELAVISYQQALKGGSDLIPAKLVGEHLAVIKSEHPEDYQKGVERFLDPPPSRYPDPRFGPQGYGYDPRGAQRPNPSLLIPAPKEGEAAKKETPTAEEKKKKE